MTLIVFIILISFIIQEYSLYRLNSDIFSPINLTMCVWIFVLCDFIIFPNILYPLGSIFIFSILLWTQSFIIGALPFNKNNSIQIINNKPILNIKIFKILVILSLIISPLYFIKIYESIGNNYVNLFIALRVNSNSGLSIDDLGPLIYVKVFNSALLIVAFWEYRYVGKKIVIYLILINLLIGISIMEKGSFFLILISGLYVLKEKRLISLKSLFLGLLIFLFVSFLFNGLRRGDSPNEGFLNFFSIYIMSPSVAYETLTPQGAEGFGTNTFSFFYKLFNSIFGTSFATVDKLKDPVFVPVLTNVFTVMQPFYEDFGYFGILIFGTIYGIFSGYLYSKRNSSSICRCLYTYQVTILILQFFQENLFVSLSVLIQYLIIWYLCYNSYKFKKLCFR